MNHNVASQPPSDTAHRIASALVTDMAAIASPPEVYLKVSQLAEAPWATLDHLAAVILRDPALAARLLRAANSPWYGMANRVETVSRAVMVLGLAEVRKLVTAASAIEAFSRLSSAITNMNTFWRHAVYTGLMAQALARHQHVLHPERLFVAGLLHDLGTLLLNHRYPESAAALIVDARGDEQALYQLESDTLGFDHAMVGSLMLEHWELPPATTQALAWHHDPAMAPAARMEAALLHAADRLANASGTGRYSELQCRAPLLARPALERLGLSAEFDLDALFEAVDREFAETACLFLA